MERETGIKPATSFEWFIGPIPPCDSSVTYERAVRLLPWPADLLLGWAAGVSEVSRFSCLNTMLRRSAPTQR